MQELPEILAEFADVAGKEAARQIAFHFGGSLINIPPRIEEADWLIDVVGRDAAKALVTHFRTFTSGAHQRERGTGRIEIPMGPAALMAKAHAAAETVLAEGGTVAKAGAASGLSPRTIYRIKRKQRLRARAALQRAS